MICFFSMAAKLTYKLCGHFFFTCFPIELEFEFLIHVYNRDNFFKFNFMTIFFCSAYKNNINIIILYIICFSINRIISVVYFFFVIFFLLC